MLNGKILGAQIMGQLSSQGIVGPMMPSLSMAFGDGIVNSFVTMNQVITMDTGFMTVGVGIGKLIGINDAILASLAIPLMASATILGVSMVPMTQAISKAVVQHFLLMNMANTTHTGVALGTGIGKVTGLVPQVMASKVALGMGSAGIQLLPMVNAFCTSFCTHVMAMGIVNVVITGAPAPVILGVPIPSVGVGNGKIT